MRRLRRMWHRVFGHPDGAVWSGELIAGCHDCGAIFEANR